MKLGKLGWVALGAAITLLVACGDDAEPALTGNTEATGTTSGAGTPSGASAATSASGTSTTAKGATGSSGGKGITGATLCAAVNAADAGKVLGDTVGPGQPADTNLTKSHFCQFTSTGGAAKGKVQVEITEAFPLEADWVSQMDKIGLTDAVPNVGDKAFTSKVAKDGGRLSVHKGSLVYWVVIDKPGATPDQLLPGMTELVTKLFVIT